MNHGYQLYAGSIQERVLIKRIRLFHPPFEMLSMHFQAPYMLYQTPQVLIYWNHALVRGQLEFYVIKCWVLILCGVYSRAGSNTTHTVIPPTLWNAFNSFSNTLDALLDPTGIIFLKPCSSERSIWILLHESLILCRVFKSGF